MERLIHLGNGSNAKIIKTFASRCISCIITHMGNTIYRAMLISPMSPERVRVFRDGAIVVKDGKIVEVGEFAKITGKDKKAKILHFKEKVIIPGLIDCHLHLPQLDQRGKHGLSLLEWLQRYIFPSEAAFADTKMAEDVIKRFFKKLILNGTTTAVTYLTIHKESADIAFEIGERVGLKLLMGKVMMDQNSPRALLEKTDVSIKESLELYEKWDGRGNGRLRYVFTPRFAPTCSERMWHEIGEILRQRDAYLQTHIAETEDEVRLVKKLFPRYKNYADLIDKNGCLGKKTLLAHAIYLSEPEWRLLKERDAAIVHCPSSNLFLKSGRMRVEKVEGYGIRYALGTDVGAGTSFSLFSVMRCADYIQPKITITPTKAFYLATLGGAKALSLDKSSGSLDKGKDADFCVVDIKGIDPRYEIQELDAHEILSLLMYRGRGEVIEKVFVRGKELDVDSSAFG